MNFDTDSILALTAFCTALASLARALRSLYDTRDSQENDHLGPDCFRRGGFSIKPGPVGALPRRKGQVR